MRTRALKTRERNGLSPPPYFDKQRTIRPLLLIFLLGYRIRGDIISNYSIQNVVASANLGIELDLTELALNLNGAEYEPETFPGLIFRLKEPKTATLLFRSGKLVCTGATNLDQVNKAVKTVVASIRKAGVKVDAVPPVQVQNIVLRGPGAAC